MLALSIDGRSALFEAGSGLQNIPMALALAVKRERERLSNISQQVISVSNLIQPQADSFGSLLVHCSQPGDTESALHWIGLN